MEIQNLRIVEHAEQGFSDVITLLHEFVGN